ncbi:MAG TPA: alpha-L-fucosidase [Spirochaetia bacterium]|nr:alpha-L-fucosidase [Spirochaetia bacterium]
MKELNVTIPDGIHRRLEQHARDRGISVSDAVALVLSHAFGSFNSKPAIDPARSQREGAQNDPRLDWWREAKFGMFIHWGLYAIPAGRWDGREIPGIGEWIMYRAEIPVAEYEKLAGQFNPVKFDAAEWVGLAKRAGQKYLVLTTKHHDGFCLFESGHTPYTIVEASPFARDVVKELAEECRKQGIKLGFYYSQTQDWHHPDGDGNYWDFDAADQDFDSYIHDYVIPQLEELLTNYGPVGLIWFDTPKGISQQQSQDLLDAVYRLQPDCLVCGRLGNGMGDYASAGDNTIPGGTVDLDWETPATINDTWGFKANDENWKSSEDLIRKLVDIASKGGNYLLNVGPTAEGVIPEPSVQRLEDMGAWLEANGESIYGSKAGPIQGAAWGRTTAKGGTVYLHVFERPADGRIPVTGLRAKRATLVATGEPLGVSADGDEVIVPEQAPGAVVTVIAVETA